MKRINSVGGNTYMTRLTVANRERYEAVLSELEENGFQKFIDNGEGIDASVFCAIYQKEETTVTVTYFAGIEEVSIAYSQYLSLSEHLMPQQMEADTRNHTMLHMPELWEFGTGFIFQLKNGHFLISDGGTRSDTEYFLAYLESLVPVGTIPVIEGWFITHTHSDHCGLMFTLLEHPEWWGRVCVDGIYFNEPSEKIFQTCGGFTETSYMKRLARSLKGQNGQKTAFYRPQTGQKYYFCDVEVQILLSQEQVAFEEYRGDENAASTVALVIAEGQKCLLSGDIHEQGLGFLMKNYSREYLNLDFFALNHHGYNTYLPFMEYVTIRTLLIPAREFLPIRKRRENNEVLTRVTEWYMYGNGTKVFTLPYQVGEVKVAELDVWDFHKGEERPPAVKTMYTIPSRRMKAFLFDGDEVLFGDGKIQNGAAELLSYLKEQDVHLAVFSRMETWKLEERLRTYGIQDFFVLSMGSDILAKNSPFEDAMYQMERKFQLDSLFKYTILCNTEEVVCAAFRVGMRALIVEQGKEIDEKLAYQAAGRNTILDLNAIYEYFEENRVLFE